MSFSAVILAAGKASRFGSCKQLAEINGQPMLQHLIDAAAPLSGDIHVISGHWHNELTQAFDHGQLYGAQLHYNPHWAQGMGQSIAFGVSQLAPHYDGILVLLSDQIALVPEHIHLLLQQFDGQTIICSEYEGRRGAPALFPTGSFPALQALRGDQGARQLLNSTLPIISCAIPAAAIDIDSPDALETWLSISEI